ncbi:hypothetical protein SEA_NIGHTMARE_82 [Arthrobacter phage Nightmare]|uniref:Uncharacterized protein n=1 Tax=Arthrobacter phage Nightmare TaxID=2015864 RepID=A0A221J6M7_9CAUD|nr:hypothetical protein QCN33_gp82 [Arthrobacter phage Nightmare]ASM62355.1 hypothetical protein SEA_NIGHTMARE_82 [Arthrobacter phage Nightmare]
MSETQEEYDKRQQKRKVRALQKATDMKYTTALRVIEDGPGNPDHPDHEHEDCCK